MTTPAGLPPEPFDDRLPPRFWTKVNVDPTSGCWLWIAAKTAHGYANFSVSGAALVAHRVAYEALVGPIPAGLDIDHLCRTRHCVNPAHLEPVTRRENILRGEGWTAVQHRKTHCLKGHPFNEENTYLIKRGSRSCRKCNAAAVARYKARKKDRA